MENSAALDAVFALAGGGWLLADLSLLRDVFAVPPLPAARPGLRPRVTAIVPARDEAERIEGTVRGLLSSRDVDLQVIVVDDRSTDATGAIVARIAATDPRVELVRVDALPEGWLGKPHACQRGGERASGDWILFTDGDIHMTPEVLARAIAAGAEERVEHVVLTPGIERPTLAARAAVATFALGLIGPLARANRDERYGWAGIGAFNLVEARAWRAIGGHTRLAYEVVDDMKLGLLLRRGGFRTRGFLGGREIRAAWGRSAGEILRLLEKNQFAFFGFDVVATLAFLGLGAALWLAGPIGFAHGGPFGLFAGLAWAAFAIPAAVGAARDGENPLFAAFAPLGAPILLVAVARSMWTTLRRGGVVWRGTLYPLAELRARRICGFSARA
ncbi:MAG: glycosyltransferase family 2 protein [Planctomycetota bacterium]|nr:glycosyltransferase family 2 protein [Planctomycetota bacterium]